MPSLLTLPLALLSLLALHGAGGGIGGGGEGAGSGGEQNKGAGTDADPGGQQGGDEKPKPEPVTVAIEGKTYVLQDHANRLIGDARKEGRAVEAAAREKAEDEAKRQREIDEQAKRGEFDEARKTIEGERDAARTERDQFKARAERAEAILKPQVEAAWSNLPAEVAEMFDGEADDLLAKADFINKTKALVDRIAGQKPAPGNPPGPKPIGATGGEEIKSPISRRQIVA